jgi:hypothetical protein
MTAIRADHVTAALDRLLARRDTPLELTREALA